MDDTDIATINDAFFNRIAIDQARARIAAGAGAAASAVHCAECGDPIPQARRDACPGCALCVQCQAETERR